MDVQDGWLKGGLGIFAQFQTNLSLFDHSMCGLHVIETAIVEMIERGWAGSGWDGVLIGTNGAGCMAGLTHTTDGLGPDWQNTGCFPV